MKLKNNKKGFTLVELVIVIAVIAILAAVLIPTFGSVINNANRSVAESEARSLQIIIKAEYMGDFDAYCENYELAEDEEGGYVLTEAMYKELNNVDEMPTIDERAKIADCVSKMDINTYKADATEHTVTYTTTNNYFVTITANSINVVKVK